MRARLSTWGKRACVVALLQVGVLWPLLRPAGATPVDLPSKSTYVKLGEYETPVPIGTVDFVKKLHVEPEVYLEGPRALDVQKRLDAMMPRVRDEMRAIVARQDYLEVTTLQARERMALQIQRTLARVLEDDEVREVVFDSYELR